MFVSTEDGLTPRCREFRGATQRLFRSTAEVDRGRARARVGVGPDHAFVESRMRTSHPTTATAQRAREIANRYDIGRAAVMSAQQERARAGELVAMRVGLWQSLLSYAPLAPGIADAIEAASEERPSGLTPYRRAARAVRDHTRRSTEEAFARAAKTLAEAMATRDAGGAIATELVRQHEALERRDLRGVRIAQRLPVRDSRPFAEHVLRIRAAEAELRRARNAFAEANLRLVVKMARRYVNDHLSLHDLVQEGNLGLMTAIDRFEVHRGHRFSTYACWWIRHAIQRAIANKGRMVRVPCHMGDAHARVNRARWQLRGRLGRAPTTDEVAAAAKVAPETIAGMDRLVLDPIRSLDAPVGPIEGATLMDTLLDPEHDDDPARGIEHEQMRERLHEALSVLSPIECDVLRRRFGFDDADELTLREVGQRYSLSRERIRQIQAAAIEKLREAMRG
jgi:RNA polymerase primary sigma factor